MAKPQEHILKLTLEELKRLNRAIMTLAVTRGDFFIIGLKINDAYLAAVKAEEGKNEPAHGYSQRGTNPHNHDTHHRRRNARATRVSPQTRAQESQGTRGVWKGRISNPTL